MTPNRSATAIRLSPELLERLRSAAAERGISMNLLITKAVEELLDNLIPVAELRYTRPREANKP